MKTSLQWGILSTGRIAGIFARGVAHSQSGQLAAVGSRSLPAAKKFAQEFGVARAHGSYEALLADPGVEAVYIATPHPLHVEWIVRAAEAGKHVLCEKPLGLNYAEAMVAEAACRAHGVVLMEAFMYRCHPQTAKVVELVRSGAIGAVHAVQATFSFDAGFNAEHRLWSNALGGGGMLDVGCYPVSFARLIAGAAAGQAFLNPVQVSGAAQLHPETGVDLYAAGTMKFATGFIAQVAAGISLGQDSSARIYGREGWIHVPSPWIPPSEGEVGKIFVHKGGAVEEIAVATPEHLYGLEADAFAAALARGAQDVPQMSVADTLGNLAALDAWREAAGLVYESERPETFLHTHTRRPLAKRADAPMRYGRIEGLALPVSRLPMGCDNQTTMAHGAAVWDDYVERGGNTFDTAYVYGGGLQEKLLGQWIRNRGVRSQVVVMAKGAHTPFCTPEWLTRQLEESMARLQTDYVDLYLMHRDNPEVPVGEFVDVLNAHVRAGKIKVFGGSNWTIERMAAANEYARRKGVQGFGVLSNNFSLARMVDPVWGGCISASDAATRRWLTETQTPLLAWSSQARGFFTERAGRDKLGDEQLSRCWYAEDNWQRRERAYALAKEKGVSPINIAAAYVLHQPFPTFALIGPRVISETVSSMPCLKVSLTPEEVAWLNLERDTV
ncbi:aldo/keto reductase [Horticoccus luteus]|uniref:Aldo/keto reductase n=1 Tax=Horticoccus luteus TaxID=2862869 RepID=A0A8F9XKB1_9BACT|nr:aldo/keto reductase [Horticoccus luteus]QYM79523.1 aldo/keto reductase [Horticoccus luteus]